MKWAMVTHSNTCPIFIRNQLCYDMPWYVVCTVTVREMSTEQSNHNIFLLVTPTYISHNDLLIALSCKYAVV